MLEARLLRHHRVPGDALGRRLDRVAGEIGERHTVAGDGRHLLIAEEHDVAGMAQHRRHIRRHQELAVAHADDDRRAVSDGHQLVRVVCGQQHHAEQTADQRERPADRVLQPVVAHLPLDQVRNNLGVGLGLERMALVLELELQLQVVLDNPVVHDDDAAGAVAVGVGVFLGRPAVSRPPGVAQTVVAVHRVLGDRFLEARQLSGAAAHLDVAVAHECHARRVVAAILQPAEPLDQDRDDRLLSDVADDAAHVMGTRSQKAEVRRRKATHPGPSFGA